MRYLPFVLIVVAAPALVGFVGTASAGSAPAPQSGKDKWSVQPTQVDGQTLVVRMNLSALDFVGDAAHPVRVDVAVPFIQPHPGGLNSQAEAEELWQIEDRLVPLFTAHDDARLVLVTRGRGQRLFQLYARSADTAKRAFATLQAATSDRTLKLTTAPDPTWSAYREAAFPNESAFWRWFRDHETALQAMHTSQEPIAEQLIAELHKIDSHLTIEVQATAGPRRDLIISADGVREAFPAVRRLVALAPSSQKWNIIGFRPRSGAPTIEIGDVTLKASAVWFRVDRRLPGGPLDLTFFVAGVAPERAMQAFYLLLDATLGEFDVETRLRKIDLLPAPADPTRQGLLPLSRLTAVVDQR